MIHRVVIASAVSRASDPSTCRSNMRWLPCAVFGMQICIGNVAIVLSDVPSHIAILPCRDSARHGKMQNCAVAHPASTDIVRWPGAVLPIV